MLYTSELIASRGRGRYTNYMVAMVMWRACYQGNGQVSRGQLHPDWPWRHAAPGNSGECTTGKHGRLRWLTEGSSARWRPLEGSWWHHRAVSDVTMIDSRAAPSTDWLIDWQVARCPGICLVLVYVNRSIPKAKMQCFPCKPKVWSEQTNLYWLTTV